MLIKKFPDFLLIIINKIKKLNKLSRFVYNNIILNRLKLKMNYILVELNCIFYKTIIYSFRENA